MTSTSMSTKHGIMREHLVHDGGQALLGEVFDLRSLVVQDAIYAEVKLGTVALKQLAQQMLEARQRFGHSSNSTTGKWSRG